MKVYELREDDYDGSGHGLFATRELAEAEIVRLALAGGVKKVTIDELEISGEPGATVSFPLPNDLFDNAIDVFSGEFSGGAPLPWAHSGNGRIVDAAGVHVFSDHARVEADGTTGTEDLVLADLIVALVNGWARSAGLIGGA